jgi:enoyl-CoA hydratase
MARRGSTVSSAVRWKLSGRTAWITLHRARAANRVDAAAAQELCEVCATIEHDPRVAVVVVAPVGEVFCAGIEEAGPWQDLHDWIAAVAGLSAPVIAAVNGEARAEGFELALSCDLRIAASSATFSLPQLQEGRLPTHGATQRLPRLVGRTRALEILLSGRRVGSREAERIGIVSRVAPRGQLSAVVRREARGLEEKGAIALRLAKEAVGRGPDLTLEQGIRLEQDLYVLLQTTRDRREGIEAFLGKRKPRFRGR